jgi:DNA-binding transcriptional ArsR family regulator
MPQAAIAADLACVCKALSAETRVRILQLLGPRPLCVNALADRLGVTQSAASQHLRILRAAGLVRGEKRGYFVHYALNEANLQRAHEQLATLLRAPQEPGRCAGHGVPQ